MNALKYRLSTAAKALSAIMLAGCFLIYGQECAEGVLTGLYFCAAELIPSLFPFMFLSAFISKGGLISKLSKPLSVIGKAFFGLSESTAAVILAITGGFPVGAKCIRELLDSGAICEKEAEKAAYISVGAGPGFIISFVGIKLFSSAELGLCLFSAQLISVILLGVLNKHICKGSFSAKSTARVPSAGTAFIDSIISAVYGLLEMCGIVAFFSAVQATIGAITGDDRITGVADVFLEVTNACEKLSESGIIPVAFAVGFGGLCVHFQVFRALGNIRLSKLLFFLYRIIQGLITAALTYAFIGLFHIPAPVFSSAKSFAPSLSAPIIGSVMFVITSVFFIYTICKERL